ncbi:heavy metal-associated isoprenylated plant protein 39-like [Zingiber officinale]|uniref:heavy metal-associated isoprenylated plant protein 39-like n=1 Tax=Zingiber officinale TaxID=94328 RepID=UPI001C4C4A27|nr:heavy metal-associated isoprenylated plant protein 39-like [Zingiber officinale]
MKKIVLKLDITDVKEKHKAMKVVSTLSGIDSIGIDMKEKKMIVIGSVDPVSVVMKLRKSWHTNVVSIGPAKEEKKEEPKKEEPKKEEPKKEEAKKEEAKEEKKEEKKEEGKKEETKEEVKKEEAKKEEAKKEEAKKEPHQQMATEPVNPYKIYYYPPTSYYPPTNYYPHTAYNNPYNTSNYYYAPSAQENPNSCSIM